MYELQLEAATRAAEEVNTSIKEKGIVAGIERLPAKGFFDVYNKMCADLSKSESVDIKGLDIIQFYKGKKNILRILFAYILAVKILILLQEKRF